MKEIKHTCETCEHNNDSGTEYCGCCDGMGADNWQEAGWRIEERLEAELRKLRDDICPSWMGKDKGCNEAEDVKKLQDENEWLKEQVVSCPFCCHSFKTNWINERDKIDKEKP